MANIILILLLLTYLILLPFHVGHVKGTGDQNVGLVIGFYIFIAYAILSIVTTIMIAKIGGFNWVSNTILWRNVCIGVLWFGMVAGFLICMTLKTELSFGNKSTGFIRLLLLLIYNGGIWLPLFMLLSYWSILNPESRFSFHPNLYKTLLLLSSLVGLLTLLASAPIRNMVSSNSDEYKFNQDLKQIDNANSVLELFDLTTKTNDERQLKIILSKIKDHPNLEDEMIKILLNNNPFIFSSVYDFIYNNGIGHPERFIEPINLNLSKINSQIESVTLAPWVGVEGFDDIKIQPIFRVMYKYFSENREPFRLYVLVIKKTLETPEERNKGNKDTAQFETLLNNYIIELKNWLDGH